MAYSTNQKKAAGGQRGRARKSARSLYVNVTGSKAVEKKFIKLRAEMPATAAALIEQAAESIAEQARLNLRTMSPPAVDTEALVRSIEVRLHGLQSTVGTSVEHGPYIEYGTRPHWPPPEPIIEWCLRHNMPASAAFPIARKIAEVGTPARPWLYPAFAAGQKTFLQRMRDGISVALPRIVK